MAEIKSITMTDGSGTSKKETRIEVRKIKNGYIQRTTTDWQDPKKGYCCDTVEEYFEENPIKGIKLPN